MNQAVKQKSNLTAKAAAFAVALLALGCAQYENKSAPPRDERRVGIDKTQCETNGPLVLKPDAEKHFLLETIPPRAEQTCAIVVPIDPRSLNLMAIGSKLYDYRRGFPTDLISHVVFFNTVTREIAAVAEVVDTIAGGAYDVANATWADSGTSLNGARNSFGGQPYGFAIRLKNLRHLTTPLSLEDARTLDPKFQRPFGYLFLDRHPVIEAEVQHRLEPLPDPDGSAGPTAEI